MLRAFPLVLILSVAAGCVPEGEADPAEAPPAPEPVAVEPVAVEPVAAEATEPAYDPMEGQALMEPEGEVAATTIEAFWTSLHDAIRSGDDERVLDHFHYPVTYNEEVMDRETFARSEGGLLFTDDEHVRRALLDTPLSDVQGSPGEYVYSIGVGVPIPGEDFEDEFGVYGKIQTLQGALAITSVGIVG